MKRSLVILLVGFCIASCSHDTRKYNRKKLNNRIVEGRFIDDSIFDGEIKYFAYTGYLEARMFFNNGQHDGAAIVYFPNGKIWDSSFYHLGLKEGSHYVFDSVGRLLYVDFYYHGQRLGGKTFYKNGKIERYLFDDFEKHQLYEGLYDSIQTVAKYGGEIVNANLYKAEKNGINSFGIFAYVLNPPNIRIGYTVGLVEDKTNETKDLFELNRSSVFVDTILSEPSPGWSYYVKADYNDSLANYRKIFLTVLKW
jgi:hypothetical protein